MPLRAAAVVACIVLSLLAGCARHRVAPAQSKAGISFDRNRGKLIFAAQCRQCHGAGGTGGAIGPALRGERKKHSLDRVIDIVKNPDPPMPKLFPAQMTQRDVLDVSAYVESL
ncbi:MAG TPA: cytochrome c [Candidatus Baltobacteraceae bacterium]|jgi:alcohol dehydrogenase (cytochrome c)